jgi:hypothetical protein
MSRRLELVTNFADLRPGMDVVLMPCGCCGSSHESRLGEGGIAANGLPGWTLVPGPSCIKEGPMLCTALAVKNRRVLRVTETEERTRELVAADPRDGRQGKEGTR